MNAANVEFRRLLQASGWRQARAAAALGLSTGTVSQYVHDKTVPSLTVLRLLAALIGESVRIRGETPAPPGQPAIREIWEEELMVTIRKVAPERRRRVVEAVITTLTACEMEKVVNNSPLPNVPPSGRGKDPVLDRLQAQASAVVDKLIADRKPGGLLRRRAKNEPPS